MVWTVRSLILGKGKPLVSIIVPTYNERENLPILVERISKALNGKYSYEIIVVDDNSPDKTWEVALELASKGYPVRLLRRPGKLGLGTAVLDGLKKASGEYIVVMDADLQHPPEVLPKLVEKALSENADIVVASRYMPGGGVEGWSFIRKLISKTATLIAKIVLPQARKTSDPMSGFFLFRKDIVENVSLNPLGYKILLEILVKARYRRVVDVPYVFHRRLHGESKLGVKEIWRYIKHVLRLSEYRPLKFAVVGASGVLVNEGVLFLGLTLGLGKALAGLLSIEASIISNFILNDIWTFRSRRKGSMLWRLIKYHFSVALGAVIMYSVYFTLAVILGFNPYISMLIGIVLGFIANYLLSEIIVWR